MRKQEWSNCDIRQLRRFGEAGLRVEAEKMDELVAASDEIMERESTVNQEHKGGDPD